MNQRDLAIYSLQEHDFNKIMAGHNQLDRRLESLVVETATLWDDSTKKFTPERKRSLSATFHRHPHLAAKITYERVHTGFTRVITISEEDLAQLNAQHLATE